jgi:hypothetical protein
MSQHLKEDQPVILNSDLIWIDAKGWIGGEGSFFYRDICSYKSQSMENHLLSLVLMMNKIPRRFLSFFVSVMVPSFILYLSFFFIFFLSLSLSLFAQ